MIKLENYEVLGKEDIERDRELRAAAISFSMSKSLSDESVQSIINALEVKEDETT